MTLDELHQSYEDSRKKVAALNDVLSKIENVGKLKFSVSIPEAWHDIRSEHNSDIQVYEFNMFYEENVYSPETRSFSSVKEKRTLMFVDDFSFDKLSKAVMDFIDYHKNLKCNCEIELRLRTSAAIRQIFETRPDLDKIDIDFSRNGYNYNSVEAVRNDSGTIEDVLISFSSDDSFNNSEVITPSSLKLTAIELHLIYEIACHALNIAPSEDLFQLSIVADIESQEKDEILDSVLL